MVVQRVKTSLRRPLGRSTQSSLQFSHFVVGLTPAGVVRSARGGHSLTLTCAYDMITAGTSPSGRVVLRDHRQYYGPLGLPLHSARLHLRLIRATLPRRRPWRRVSRVPHFSFNACCAPYPGETRCACLSEPWRIGRGLRREMSGSALGLFLFRGCKLHFMLRPALLLPPQRLLTSRLGHGDLSPRLGPATRRFGAYRDGTSTRWRSAARNRARHRFCGSPLGFVTTHHVAGFYPESAPGCRRNAPPSQPGIRKSLLERRRGLARRGPRRRASMRALSRSPAGPMRATFADACATKETGSTKLTYRFAPGRAKLRAFTFWTPPVRPWVLSVASSHWRLRTRSGGVTARTRGRLGVIPRAP